MHTEDHIEELIIACLSGKATPDDKQELAEWIRKDPEHKRHYQQMRNIWQVTHPAFQPEEIHVGEAHAAFMKKLPFVPWYHKALVYWQRAAAILLLPLIVCSVYLQIENGDKEEPATSQEVMAPYGTRSKVNLPDGSVAWLNAGSVLEFPTTFKKGERTVQLKGEAFFEVEADTDNPFVVKTNILSVQATGTAFNVEAYEKDSTTFVTMVNGKISVSIGNARPFAMMAGERMKYNLVRSDCQVTKTDPYKWCAWKDGLMIFRDDPLSEVFKRLEQTFNVDIVIRDAEISRYLYRATFENESLDEILRLLKMTAPIRYKKFERGQSSERRYSKQRIEVSRQ